MDDNTKAKLLEPFDRSIIKERVGPGGRTLAYVTIAHYIGRLNDAFGFAWDYELTDVKFLDEEIVVQVRLTVPGRIVKMAVGGASITKRRDNGQPVSIAHDVMAAEATALKRAARLLGIGATLYADDDDEHTHASERVSERRGDSPRITSAQLGKLRSLVPDWAAYRSEVRERHGVNIEFATKGLASQLIDELVRATANGPHNGNGHGDNGLGTTNGHANSYNAAGRWRRP